MKKRKVIGILFLACTLMFSSLAWADKKVEVKGLNEEYKMIIDSMNQVMNTTLYQNMTSKIQECALKGDYVMAAFMSQYLYLLFNDFVAMSKTEVQARQNQKLAEHFKGTYKEMVMYYNNDAKDKQALPDLLQKCQRYYYQTKTRITLTKDKK